MSAALLREAADRLDELADAVDTTPTTTPDGDLEFTWADQITFLLRQPDAAYVTAMSPTVGKALAAWLRAEAVKHAEVDALLGGFDLPVYDTPADLVARAVLGRAA